MSSLVGCHQPQ